MREAAAAAAAPSISPLAASAASVSPIADLAWSAAPMRVSNRHTRWPACAAICAMPYSMAPAPMMPTWAALGSASATLFARELRRTLGEERSDAFAVVRAAPEFALEVAFEVELASRVAATRHGARA